MNVGDLIFNYRTGDLGLLVDVNKDWWYILFSKDGHIHGDNPWDWITVEQGWYWPDWHNNHKPHELKSWRVNGGR